MRAKARGALEQAFAALEAEFAAAPDAKAREKVATRIGILVRDGHDAAGMSEPEAGEWALRKLIPHFKKHPGEIWACVMEIPDSFVPNGLLERVLPSDLMEAARAQAKRVTDLHAENGRKWSVIRRFHPAAEKGDAAAQLALGQAYQQGPGGEPSLWPQALYWMSLAKKNGAPGAAAALAALEKSVQQRYQTAAKNPAALLALHRQKANSKLEDAHVGAYLAAKLLMENPGAVEKDHVEAKSLLEAAAKKNYANAMFELAQLELMPRQGEPNEPAALKWLRADVQAGHTTAGAWIELLAAPPAERGQQAFEAGQKAIVVKTVGNSTSVTMSPAVPWFRYSAHLGNPRGLEFQAGQELTAAKPDLKKAFALYLRAAEGGSPTAMSQLAEAYQRGRGTTMDLAAARVWRVKAAGGGGKAEQNRAGEILLSGEGGSVDFAGARSWFMKAAEQGQLAAMHHLGEMAFAAQGMAKSDTEAIAWWQRAADQNYADAQVRLALMYRDGRGVAANLETARTLLTAAVATGNKQEAELLQSMGDGAIESKTP